MPHATAGRASYTHRVRLSSDTAGFVSGMAEAMQAPFAAFDQPSADARAAATPMPDAILDRPLGAARAQVHETYIIAQTRDSW